MSTSHERPPLPNRRSRTAGALAALALLTAGLGLGTTAALCSATPAAAHAILESTEPSAGSAAKQAPTAVTLHFDEQVEVSFGSVRLYDSKGSRIDDGRPSHPPSDSHAVRLALPHLANGSYVVTWRVISADSHPVHGAFTFRVGAGQASDTSSLTQHLLASDGGNRSTGVAYGSARLLAFASVLALVGGTIFLLGPWPAGRGDRRARRVLMIAWSGAVLTALIGIPLQGLYAAGLPLSKLLDRSVSSGALDTRFGKVWLARAIVLVLMAPLLRAIMRSTGPRPSAALMASGGLGGVVLAASFGVASHPGTGSMVPLAVLADTVHVAAASIWLGGLLVLFACVLVGRGAPNAATIVRRFSPIAFWAVIVIAASGVYQGWREVGSIDALTHTTYGRLLMIKLALFGLLIVLARTSRNWLRARHEPGDAAQTELAPVPVLVGAGGPSTIAGTSASPPAPTTPKTPSGEPPPDQPTDLRVIRRSVGAEVLVAAVLLAVTSLLVNAQPGRTALARPFSAELHAQSVLIDVGVDPAKAGNTTVHVYTLTPDGAVKDVKDLTATFAMPDKGIAPISVPLRRAGPGHFAAYGFDLPISGHWTLTVKALLTDIDESEASTTVHVR